MLRLYREKPGNVKDPEKFLRIYKDYILYNRRVCADVLREIENVELLSDNRIRTFAGVGELDDLKTVTKICLCATAYPVEIFPCINLRTEDLEKVMKLKDGSIYVEMQEPARYFFTMGAMADTGERIQNSTDLNLWYFRGGNRSWTI